MNATGEAGTAQRDGDREDRKRAGTLGDSLRSGSHTENGFDTIRLVAAALVLVSHSFPIVTGSNSAEPLHRLSGGQATLGTLSVGAFFVVSGLLISNSFDHSRGILSFVRRRALRIMPALIVVCLLLVVMLGPLLTNCSVEDYFSGAWKFMANAVFLPHDYTLPGVFEDHPVEAVNGSLWTLKFEVACYAIAAAMLSFKALRLTLVAVAWIASLLLTAWLDGGTGVSTATFYIGELAFLYQFFGAGVIMYLLSDRLVLRASYAWVAAAVALAAALTPFFVPALATLGAYAVIVFGYNAPTWFQKITADGDISYGTYVYAFPVQQLVLPLSLGSVAFNIALALPLTLVAGVVSWRLVEQPLIQLKTRREAAVVEASVGVAGGSTSPCTRNPSSLSLPS